MSNLAAALVAVILALRYETWTCFVERRASKMIHLLARLSLDTSTEHD